MKDHEKLTNSDINLQNVLVCLFYLKIAKHSQLKFTTYPFNLIIHSRILWFILVNKIVFLLSQYERSLKMNYGIIRRLLVDICC